MTLQAAPLPAATMTPRPRTFGAGSGRTVIARTVARRLAPQALLWGVVYGLFVWASAYGYTASYGTVAGRETLARTFAANSGLAMMLGQPRGIATVEGFTAWRTLGVVAVAGSVWGLLTGTRLMRGEEEAGRWELLLAGRTTRVAAAVQATAALVVGWLVLTAVVTGAVLLVAAGPDLSASWPSVLFFAAVATAGTGVFLAVGALTSQLAGTRRRAAMLAGAVFGACLVLRMISDSASSLRWLAWLTPLGWASRAQPFTGSRTLPLYLLAALVITLLVATWLLAGARDIDAGVLDRPETGAAHLRGLDGPLGLTIRTSRAVVLGWLAALVFFGFLFGLVAKSASAAVQASTGLRKAITQLGGGTGTGAATYLGVTMLIGTTLIMLVAAGRVSDARAEEADGRLDQLLARPVSRTRWLAAHLAVAATVLVLCGIALGLAEWAGTAAQSTGIPIATMLAAGINTVPAALVVLGAGTLLHAIAPRAATFATYAVVAWSFLIEFVATVVPRLHFLRDTSLLYHLAPAPAVHPHWATAAALVSIGAGAAGLGIAGFRYRDIARN